MRKPIALLVAGSMTLMPLLGRADTRIGGLCRVRQ